VSDTVTRPVDPAPPSLDGSAVPEAGGYRPRPEGPVAIAVFSACCGIFALGLASLANQGLNPLQWIPIPGLTPADQLNGGRRMIFMWSNFAQMTGLFFTMMIVWVVVWVVLHESYAHRHKVGRRWYVASAALLAAGLVLSCPLFYQWIFPEPFSAPLRLGQPFTGGSGVRLAPDLRLGGVMRLPP